MMGKTCVLCGRELMEGNIGRFCFICQEKLLRKIANRGYELTYDVTDLAGIFRLSHEQVRRMKRDEKLPPTIRGTRKLLWFREDIIQWIRPRHKKYWKPEEEDEAIKLAQMKGVPVEGLTLYGYYPEGLIKWYRAEIGLSKVG